MTDLTVTTSACKIVLHISCDKIESEGVRTTANMVRTCMVMAYIAKSMHLSMRFRVQNICYLGTWHMNREKNHSFLNVRYCGSLI
jgi:hypothetical protein